MHLYSCKGPSARTALERKLCLVALAELEKNKNVDLWASRIEKILLPRKGGKPIFLRTPSGKKEIFELIRSGAYGVYAAWTFWKNEHKGCGQVLDDIYKELEATLPEGTETYRMCPKCGTKDFTVVGRTDWGKYS